MPQTQHLSILEDSSLFDRASLSSIEDMLQSDAEDNIFQTHQSTNQRDASTAFCHRRHCLPVCAQRSECLCSTQPFQPDTSQPNSRCFWYGVSFGSFEASGPNNGRQNSLKYVDLALLLSDNLYQSQFPEIQLHLDDSSSCTWVSLSLWLGNENPL